MGNTGSSQQDITIFIAELDKFKFPDVKDPTRVLSAAANLVSLNCISNSTLQQLYLREPNNIIMLVIRALDFFQPDQDIKLIHGSTHILARLLPTLALSVSDPDKLDWLLATDESLIKRLYDALKKMLFVPKVFSPPYETDATVWKWNSPGETYINTRADLMQLLFFAYAGKFFFPNHADTQNQLLQLATLDDKTAQLLMKSLNNALKAKNLQFLEFALPYTALALCHDKEFQEALKTNDLLQFLTELLYVNVDRLNSIKIYTWNVDRIEPDLLFALCAGILLQPEAHYDSKFLAIATIRLLQFANETKDIDPIHRIALNILIQLTSVERKASRLKSQFTETLGTRFVFHSDSIAVAAFEAASIALLLPDNDEIAILCASLIYNISPIMSSEEDCVPIMFNKLLNCFIVNRKKPEIVDLLIKSVARFVTGADNCEDKKAKLEIALSKLVEWLVDGQPEYGTKIQEAIAAESNQNLEPISLEANQDNLDYIQQCVIDLFAKRNKQSLENLRKHAKSE